jgi:DNA-binding transcriptional ArsR family regulator
MPSLDHFTVAEPADAVELDQATAEFDALSSETARALLTAIYDRARTPSELADAVDTSVQNVHHHLDQLKAAGLVRVEGERVSAQGREMKVYGPTRETFLLYAGDPPKRRQPPEPDGRVLAALAACGLLALAVWWRRAA